MALSLTTFYEYTTSGKKEVVEESYRTLESQRVVVIFSSFHSFATSTLLFP